MAKKTRHNPERSAWKGRSHKKGGERIAKLRSSNLTVEYNHALEFEDLEQALKPHGLTVTYHPAAEGSCDLVVIISNRELTKAELAEAAEEC